MLEVQTCEGILGFLGEAKLCGAHGLIFEGEKKQVKGVFCQAQVF